MKSRLLLIPAVAAALTFTACSSPTTTTPPEEIPAEEIVEEEVVEEAPADEGTRDNPLPLGTAITQGDWTITINQVNLDATAAITADGFNEAPADGNVYIMVEATVTYNGTNGQGEIPWATIDYVTVDGNTVSLAYVSYDEPDFTLLDPLYEGASHTGWNAYEVPAATAAEGTLAVSADMMEDSVFVAIQ